MAQGESFLVDWKTYDEDETRIPSFVVDQFQSRVRAAETQESKDLKLGGQDVSFGRLGKFVVIGRHPESREIYFAPIVDSGSTRDASINELGARADSMISILDLLMVKGGGLVEFFNLGANEAVIEAEDKF